MTQLCGGQEIFVPGSGFQLSDFPSFCEWLGRCLPVGIVHSIVPSSRAGLTPSSGLSPICALQIVDTQHMPFESSVYKIILKLSF